jgi:hypothetical protein
VLSVQAKDASFNEDATLHRVGPEATGRRLQADREAQAEARRKAEKSDPLVASPASGRSEQTTPRSGRPRVSLSRSRAEAAGDLRSPALGHPDGLATPKDPKEHVPDVPQEAVGRTPQRSSTETGVATVKDLGRPFLPPSRRTFPPPPRSGRTPRRGRRSRSPRSGAPRSRSATTPQRTGQGTFAREGRREREAEGAPKKTTRTGTAKRPSRKQS